MTTSAWVTCPRPNPQARLRLFCLPYAGGAASAFYTWPGDLPREVEVCPVQLPGRESRLGEPPFSRLEPLLHALVPTIRRFTDKPFAIFGHSLGATIGFELARRLCGPGDPNPIGLFVSGSRAPQIQTSDPGLLIHRLPDTELVEKLRHFNGTPEMVLQNAEMMQIILPSLRADFALHETYIWTIGEPLDCPIFAFGGLEDEGVCRDDLVAWREQTRGAFALRMFPGDHFFLRSARSQFLLAMSQDLMQILGQERRGIDL